ncbi:ribosome biogenesis protein BRX1, variant [Blastomyces gilchristii SLH14081]|uniref:Ribosome biogenesis protein BRX1 n=1 Tax=Blastomyces gilchristii (strain SLH14081) TaxID=559298 RepID=A0A179UQJ0_BLAGS|nr:ribosome biogenesis protein BRX1 [Blastomyces gilchristii SLH14081]XP_031579177.1 ribosome biogenesis protein BRX1, variant [Blastomyces gilchristii SLH14081]OAT10139.1 ribosome biogenesis protein BRX1 [Blastomyces gilchristii SLH14081]OAT10140.1 ribosome biogenesis protein BRX1, variant [Blastomyces gilchristii SLH14081]
MSSVYKSLSKKKNQASVTREDMEDADVSMHDLSDDLDETSDSDDYEDEDEQNEQNGFEGGVATKSQSLPSGFMPKTRVLMLTSRGVTHRHRHLLSDLTSLLPHTHKESKLDTKKKTAGYNFLLNSLADLHSCNVIFFLEAKKRGQDLYLWLSRPPNGPTIKFSVSSLHTMGEMGTGFSGNCLKGGRGVVVFDKTFDEAAVMRSGNEYRGLVREMLRSVFSVPKRGVRGMKPFIDRIIGVFGVDGKIWIRVFEIRESEGGAVAATKTKDGEAEEDDAEKAKPKPKRGGKGGAPDITLVEIGPRFVLTPIVILEGSFGGPVIYENKEFVSPNQVRREIRLRKASRFATRQVRQTDRTVKKSGLGLTTEGRGNRRRDPLETKEVFG